MNTIQLNILIDFASEQGELIELMEWLEENYAGDYSTNLVVKALHEDGEEDWHYCKECAEYYEEATWEHRRDNH